MIATQPRPQLVVRDLGGIAYCLGVRQTGKTTWLIRRIVEEAPTLAELHFPYAMRGHWILDMVATEPGLDNYDITLTPHRIELAHYSMGSYRPGDSRLVTYLYVDEVGLFEEGIHGFHRSRPGAIVRAMTATPNV